MKRVTEHVVIEGRCYVLRLTLSRVWLVAVRGNAAIYLCKEHNADPPE